LPSLYAGFTFLYPINDRQNEHLWLVATNPNEDELVVVVNITTLRGAKDQTIVLQSGEHEFIKHDSCVNYAMAEVLSIEKLHARLGSGRAKRHSDMNADLTALVLSGFTASPFTKNRIVDFIRNYKGKGLGG
jgi:hypothetical protein